MLWFVAIGKQPAASPLAVNPSNASVRSGQAHQVADLAVPQPAPAELQRQRNAKFDYLKKTVRDPYDQVGKRNPKWDAEARAALDDAVLHWCHSHEHVYEDSLWSHAKNAIDAGCDDPMILYLFARFHPGPFQQNFADGIQRFERAADAMIASKYPVARRAIALIKVASHASHPSHNPSDKAKKDALARAERAIDLLPGAARIRGAAAQHDAFSLYLEIIGTYENCGQSKAGFDRMAGKLDKDPECRVFYLLVKGAFYINYAWEARGRGWAKDVTPAGWEGMRQRLAVAAVALEEAWRLDPNNALVATQMLSVELGQNQGRERFDLWFRRAMLADGDNFDACAKKLYCLLPQWHGSREEALAFGQQCLATGNWKGQLPQILVQAHLQLTGDSTWTAAERAVYFRQPEVWRDCQSVWGGCLKQHPDSVVMQNHYLLWALECGQDAEVDRMLKLLKGNVSPRVLSSPAIAKLQERSKQLQIK
jgi:hypothetical protein